MTAPEATIPVDPLTLAIAAHERAIALRAQTKLPAAETACRRAIAHYTRAAGPRSPDVANALFELGQILEARDRPRDARKAYVRARAILGKPPARPRDEGEADVARLSIRVLMARAGVDRALGAYAVAERGFHAALAETKRAFGPRDLDVASLFNNLGVLRKYQGRFDEAVVFYKQALPMLVAAAKRDGDTGPLATLYHNLGGIEHARGRYAAGEPWARKSVALREKAHGPDDVTVAADVAALAALVEGRGRLDEAAALYVRAIAIFRRKLGPRSAEVALDLAGLASVRQAQGKLAEARRLYLRSLALQEHVFGKGHPEVAMTLNNFAALERARGELARAEALYARAYAVYREAVGPRHVHARLTHANWRAVVDELEERQKKITKRGVRR
ncbi:MAG TPA: tetratricopeptide repeat protein [Polyangia bacterium]|nr:tetratricopeptide repeat protein [Polyangia bacterium]